MGWYRRQTWEQTDNTRDAARAAESAERAAWQQTRLQAEATQAAWEAAANTARAADAAAEQARQQRWYQYTMWLQSPAGHRYQEWETQANQRRDRLNQYHAVWADAWLQATTQVIGPPPTREQLSAVVLGSERARRTTLWCAGVSFGLIFLNALFVHSGILFYPAALVLVVAVPVFGFRWLHLRNTDLTAIYAQRSRGIFGFNAVDEKELPHWDVEQSARQEARALRNFMLDAISDLPTHYPRLDHPVTVIPPIHGQAPEPVPQALEHIRQQLQQHQQMGQPQ